jgi:hypothetical protein
VCGFGIFEGVGHGMDTCTLMFYSFSRVTLEPNTMKEPLHTAYPQSNSIIGLGIGQYKIILKYLGLKR